MMYFGIPASRLQRAIHSGSYLSVGGEFLGTDQSPIGRADHALASKVWLLSFFIFFLFFFLLIIQQLNLKN